MTAGNYLSFTFVFAFILALLDILDPDPHSQCAILIQAAIEWGFNADPEPAPDPVPKHC
jgi:hypothetical protein